MGISKSYLKELAKNKKFGQKGYKELPNDQNVRIPVTGALKGTKEFYTSFMNSPRYQQMLQGKTFNPYGTFRGISSDYIRDARLRNLQGSKDNIYTFGNPKDWKTYTGNADDVLGFSKSANGAIYLNPRFYNKPQPETFEDSELRRETLSHEFSHSIDRPFPYTSVRLIPDEDIYEIQDRTLANQREFLKKKGNKRSTWEYLTEPTEIRARINSVRERLWKNGVDIGNKQITAEDIKDINTENLKDLRDVLKEEDIIWMLNNISKTETPQKEKYAQSGAYIPTEDKQFSVKKSTIPGANKGLFSKTPIKQGKLIGLAHENNQPVGTLGNMHNHSETPNMQSVKIGNQRYVYATRDIQPGEELTTNYRLQPELEQPEDFMGNKRFGQFGLSNYINPKYKNTNQPSLNFSDYLPKYNPGTSTCPKGYIYDSKKRMCVPEIDFLSSRKDYNITKNYDPRQAVVENRKYYDAYQYMQDYYNSPRYKEMLRNSAKDEKDYASLLRDRNQALSTTPALKIKSQPEDDPRVGGSSYTHSGQIEIYPEGFNTEGTAVHELSHSSDRPTFYLLENQARSIPQKDIDYINKNKAKSFYESRDYFNLLNQNQGQINPGEDEFWNYQNENFKNFYTNYVGEPTETRARLNAIRQGAKQNNLYDPFTEKVTPSIFYKKLKNFKFEKGDKEGFNPMDQLKKLYSDEEIMWMLNNISKNESPQTEYYGQKGFYKPDFRSKSQIAAEQGNTGESTKVASKINPVSKRLVDEANYERLKSQQPSFNQGYKKTASDIERSDYYKKQQESKNALKNALRNVDVVTDVMQVGNFIPHPIAQGIGQVGNWLGAATDVTQAGMDYGNQNYGGMGINLASAMVPTVIGAASFRRNSKYLRPGQTLYPFSPQAGILPGGYSRVSYIEPFNMVKGMTKTNLMANRALLGTLGVETAYDAGAFDNNTRLGLPINMQKPNYAMGGTMGIPGVNGQVVSSGPGIKDDEGNVKTMSSKQVKQTLKYSRYKPNKI